MSASVQLCIATPWSFHYGASPVESLAARAAERGVTALGAGDLNGMWGAIPFQRACEAHGVRPLHGVRLRIEGVEARLFAHDAGGYAALCRLSTRLQLAHPGTEAVRVGGSRRLQEWLAAEGNGFSLLSRDTALLRGVLADRGPEHLGVAVRPGAAGASELALAAELGLPPVAAPEVCFADPEDWARHRLLVAIGANTSLSRLAEHETARRRLAPPGAWLRGARELAEDYRYAPEALRNAAALAERCTFRIPLGVKRLPRFPVQGRTAQAHLARLCERGRRRRRLPEEPRYRAQMRRELDLIAEQQLADYFLIVADIARFARRRGIQNCGRGSAANSLVSYVLGLTHVDPLRHGLYFERFMNRGRSDYPDVDLDFAWDERDTVLDYVYRRYGRERVAMISTHATFAARGAVRELAKVMGVPAAEIGEITRAMPGHFEGRLDAAALRRHPKAARLPLDAEPWRTILAQAGALDGFPRHLGIHAGGIVIGPSPLTDHLPLQHGAKETEDGRVVITQWDMYPVEDAGLVKIDLLGNRGLAVIRDAAAAVQAHTGLRIDFARVHPQRDSRTRQILERGDTMGCFYVESPAMRGLLRKLRCGDFETLVAASSIIRPGVASSGMMQAYIDRHHEAAAGAAHRDEWYLHPAMRELLEGTYGVMTYQEDVLKVAERVAGMSPEDADGLRRSMTKKRAHHHIEAYQRKFLSGAEERGVAPGTAAELWRQIESFGGYSFCKAHSASYAEVSFRSAYLRAHHPAEFMAAVLANYGGYYSTFAYLAEARRMGLRLRLPCVNASGETFCGDGGELRVGLAQVHGLGAATRRRILAARAAAGPYRGMEDLVSRTRPQPAELEALVRAGALDTLGDGMGRATRMRAAALYGRRHADPVTGEGSLFAAAGRGRSGRRPPRARDYDRAQELRQEQEALGFLVSAHPLELCRDTIRRSGAVAARELARHIDRRVKLVGWQVTQKPVRTRDGKTMMFLSFEDTTAIYETVMFPQVYRRLAPWVLTRGPYVLTGIPRDDHGAITVDVTGLRLLEEPAGRGGAA